MGGAFSRAFSPSAAKYMISNTNSAALKSALQNYIKAVNELNNNARTENKLVALMNNTRIGMTNSYKKRIANSIASIIAKAPRVAEKAAVAAAGAAPAAPAAAAVNNLANRIKNLNQRMSELTNLAGPPGVLASPSNIAGLYITKGFNNTKNRNINKSGKYAPIWAAINEMRTKNVNVPGRQNKTRLGRIGPKGTWFFKNKVMNANFKIVGANTNNPVVYRKNNTSAPKQFVKGPNKSRQPIGENMNQIAAIKSIINNPSFNNNKKISTIKTRFPNVNYNKLSMKTNNAEVKRILGIMAVPQVAARIAAQGVAAPITEQKLSNLGTFFETNNNRKRRAAAAVLALWRHAGTGSDSNTLEGKARALELARANATLNMKNLTRMNINAILNAANFAPPTNTQGNNKARHVARVKAILNSLGVKK
jgi:hypothetical protein